jgi:hypothetical protein
MLSAGKQELVDEVVKQTGFIVGELRKFQKQIADQA